MYLQVGILVLVCTFLGCNISNICSFSLPKCGKGKPALIRRHTLEDRSELISCIENGNYAKAARIAAGNGHFKNIHRITQ